MSFLQSTFTIGLWNGWIFMSVFILQMLAIIFINKNVKEKTHLPVEARRTVREKYVSTLGNLIWFFAMVYSVFLPLQPDTLWFYIGLFVFMMGLVIMALATFSFITTSADQLIQKGIYQLSRHPMYLASFCICLGTGIATLSYPFIFLSTIMALCFYQEALIEERYCIKKYGNTYQKYINDTPRWIGRRKKSN
jgi:protein-S-isoprenylcysteine O-methyltransferase Ste14